MQSDIKIILSLTSLESSASYFPCSASYFPGVIHTSMFFYTDLRLFVMSNFITVGRAAIYNAAICIYMAAF